MDSLKDLLGKKAEDIDSEGKRDDLTLIQHELDRYFDKKIHATQVLDKGLVVVETKSSSLASELRFKQEQLKQTLNKELTNEIERFRIRIV